MTENIYALPFNYRKDGSRKVCSIVHELRSLGYDFSQISSILGISESCAMNNYNYFLKLLRGAGINPEAPPGSLNDLLI